MYTEIAGSLSLSEVYKVYKHNNQVIVQIPAQKNTTLQVEVPFISKGYKLYFVL